MELDVYYKSLLKCQKKSRDIIIDDKLLPRFKYFLSQPNFYKEYDFNEIIYNKFDKDDSLSKVLLVNFDFHDFVQAYFFRNEIIKFCNLNKIYLDVLSCYPYKNLKYELDYLVKDIQLDYGQEWLFPIDNNKWKHIMGKLGCLNQYDFIVFNGINYYFYYFLNLFPKYNGKIVVYDPHIRSGVNDFRDLKKIGDLYKFNITVISDGKEIRYKDRGYRNFIEFRHCLPSYLKEQVSVRKNDLSFFVGGDTNRSSQQIYSFAKKNHDYTFNICSSHKFDTKIKNINYYGRVPFYRYLELCNSSALSIFLLDNAKVSAGLITNTISFMFGNIIFSNDNWESRRYIEDGYNGFLFKDMTSLISEFNKIKDNTSQKAYLMNNSCKSYNEKHRLEDLVTKIFISL